LIRGKKTAGHRGPDFPGDTGNCIHIRYSLKNHALAR
jgi:hypothetical protein